MSYFDIYFAPAFQFSNVLNQKEHLKSILHGFQFQKIYEHYLNKYEEWCSTVNFQTSPFVQPEDRLLLYLCIWGESSNLRFMPEFLFFTLNCMEWSTTPMTHECYFYEITCPVYDALKAGFSRGINYDDFNEQFWTFRRMSNLRTYNCECIINAPAFKRFELLQCANWDDIVFDSSIKTFWEHRSVLSLIYMSHRVIALHVFVLILVLGMMNKRIPIIEFTIASSTFQLYNEYGGYVNSCSHQSFDVTYKFVSIQKIIALSLPFIGFLSNKLYPKWSVFVSIICTIPNIYMVLRSNGIPLKTTWKNATKWILIFSLKGFWISRILNFSITNGQDLIFLCLLCYSFLIDTILWYHILNSFEFLTKRIYSFCFNKQKIQDAKKNRLETICSQELYDRGHISEDMRSKEAIRRLRRIEFCQNNFCEYSPLIITQLIPHYNEELFSKKASHTLKKHLKDEFNVIERGKKTMKEWSSLREQTLYRTLNGFRSMRKVFPQSQCVVCLQNFVKLKETNCEDLKCLVSNFSEVQFCYIEETSENYSICLIQGNIDVVKFKIKLPGNPMLGDGKGDNQNNGIIFTRGNFIQTIDANQDGFIEEYSNLMHNIRTHFLKDDPVAILGMGEYIFSSIGKLGKFAALNEVAFGSITQENLGSSGTRLHYGHPDITYKPFMIAQGGVSRAVLTMNLSEDVFCGMESLLRGYKIGFSQFCRIGKGRNLNLISIMNFYSKLSRGNARMSTTRQAHRISQRATVGYLLDFYYAHVGFYASQYQFSLMIRSVGFLILVCVLVDNFYNTRWTLPFLKNCEILLLNEFVLVSVSLISHLTASQLDANNYYDSICSFFTLIFQGFPLFSIVQMEWISIAFESEFEKGGAAYVSVDRNSENGRRVSHRLFACCFEFIQKSIESLFVLGMIISINLDLFFQKIIIVCIGYQILKIISLSLLSYHHSNPYLLLNDAKIWLGWYLSKSCNSWIDQTKNNEKIYGIKFIIMTVISICMGISMIHAKVCIGHILLFLPWNLVFCSTKSFLGTILFFASIAIELIVLSVYCGTLSVSALCFTKWITICISNRVWNCFWNKKILLLYISIITWLLWFLNSLFVFMTIHLLKKCHSVFKKK